MRVSVLMPYRESDPWRETIFNWLLVRIYSLYPQFQLCLGDHEGEVFSRSKARNVAASKAIGDVFVIWDADTFCNDIFLMEAIQQAFDNDSWAYPYGRYYNLTMETSKEIVYKSARLDHERPKDFEHDLESWAGIFAMSRGAWERAGGYDEHFKGWGYEDNAFFLAAQAFLGPPIRNKEGWVNHLWHNAPESVRFEQPNIRYNRDRYRKYESAKNDPTAIEQIRQKP